MGNFVDVFVVLFFCLDFVYNLEIDGVVVFFCFENEIIWFLIICEFLWFNILC